VDASLDGGTDVETRTLVVADDGRWFQAPGSARVSLERRRALRLVMQALAERRRAQPGSALSADEVLAAGWPGEKIRHQAGVLRVYNAVSSLRKLGLRRYLVSRDDGYLLDPSVGLERVATRAR
jgi:hypothetical protein